LNVTAALDAVAEATRFVFALEATTKLPEDATWSLKFPYGFCGSAPQIGVPLGFGRVPIKKSSFVYVLPVPIHSVNTARILIREGGDAPQSVIFALQAAATCGFAFEYAAMITHFLVERKVSPLETQTGRREQNTPFVPDGRVDELGHRIRPHVLDPLGIVEDLRISSASAPFPSRQSMVNGPPRSQG
jgi:hypothetical protein